MLALSLLLSRCGDDTTGGSTAGAAPSGTTPTSDVSVPTAAPSSTESGPASASQPATTPSSTTAAPTDEAAGADDGGGSAGTVTTREGIVLGDTTPRPLRGRGDQDATGTGVRVQSVPADEGFWVGTSVSNRIWVQLTGDAGESAYQVKEGDTVDFTGVITSHDATFPTTVGVTRQEGADQLTQQGGHLSVDKQRITLSS